MPLERLWLVEIAMGHTGGDRACWGKLFLRHSWNKELYRSWPELSQVEIAHRPAVAAAPTGCSFGEFFFSAYPLCIQLVSHIPVSDHTAATLTPCGPIHFVGHFKPSWPGKTRVWSVVASHWVRELARTGQNEGMNRWKSEPALVLYDGLTAMVN